jgi:DNA modification methylase
MKNRMNDAEKWEAKKIFLFQDRVENLYDSWESPNVIISDGAYGVSGFKGDTISPNDLPDWYDPHIRAWSQKAKAGTTLWLWNTEIGFAKVHPTLEKYGWEYVSCNIWNKGIQHIAGNCNLKMLKSYPVVTEVCIQYVKKATFIIEGIEATLKDWLRYEWNRAGLTLQQANEACEIANAASRKYLTRDHLWYAPPPEHFENLSNYANRSGTTGKPYFSIDGQKPMSRATYTQLFATFNGKYGITNVWDTPPLHSKERIKIVGSGKYFHLNQKPIQLMELIIQSSSYEGDIIWEPFGGLFSASLAGHLLNRKVYGAEMDENIYSVGIQRFMELEKKQQEVLFEIPKSILLQKYANH